MLSCVAWFLAFKVPCSLDLNPALVFVHTRWLLTLWTHLYIHRILSVTKTTAMESCSPSLGSPDLFQKPSHCFWTNVLYLGSKSLQSGPVTLTSAKHEKLWSDCSIFEQLKETERNEKQKYPSHSSHRIHSLCGRPCKPQFQSLSYVHIEKKLSVWRSHLPAI